MNCFVKLKFREMQHVWVHEIYSPREKEHPTVLHVVSVYNCKFIASHVLPVQHCKMDHNESERLAVCGP